MGTLGQKLDYLTDTKSILKQKINNLGGSLTDQSTFRSYGDYLDELYNEMPKVTGEGTEITLTPTRKGRMQLGLKGNTSQDILPTGYTALDYIESTGTEYIDTGIYLNQNSSVEIEGNQIATNSNSLFGVNPLFVITSHSITASVSEFRLRYNNITRNVGGNVSTKSKISLKKNNGYLNNELVYTFNEGTFSSNYTAVIFGRRRNNDGGIEENKSSRIYYCKIWDNNTLVRNFVPCKNANNEVGLYDFVSQTFFGNAGTGDFVAGNEVSIPNPDYPQPIHVVAGNNTISIGNTNYPINLGSLELCKIGDYQDYFYKENGNWYKYDTITKIILDGTENWKKSELYNGSYYIDKGKPSKFYVVTAFSPLFCSHFIRANINYGAQMSNYKQGTCFIENSDGNFDVWYDDGTSTLEDFRSWVTANNLVVYCVLKTPTSTQITDETLIAQLNAIENAMSTTDTTTITQTNADLPFIISASALKPFTTETLTASLTDGE